jgi:hypothetical protein
MMQRLASDRISLENAINATVYIERSGDGGGECGQLALPPHALVRGTRA